MDNEKSDRPWRIQHASVHQKLAQVPPHVPDRRRLRRAKVDEQYARFVHAARDDSWFAMAAVTKAFTFFAALSPDTIESLSATPSR